MTESTKDTPHLISPVALISPGGVSLGEDRYQRESKGECVTTTLCLVFTQFLLSSESSSYVCTRLMTYCAFVLVEGIYISVFICLHSKSVYVCVCVWCFKVERFAFRPVSGRRTSVNTSWCLSQTSLSRHRLKDSGRHVF